MSHTSTTTNDSDAKRWLIIGAHQAGASEKRVARISGLSKTAVRHIILNYQRTGTPCLPKREPKKVKEKLLVEYDEDGNLILSDEEDDTTSLPSKSSSNKKNNGVTKKRSSKLNPKISAKDLIEYMVEQVKRVEQEFTPIPNFSSCTSMSGELQQHQHYDHSWCPTPPRDGSISSGNSTHRRDSDTINFSPHGFNKGSYHRSESPSFLPLSPPSVSCNKSTSTLDYDDDDRYNEEDQQQGRRDHSPQAPSTAGSTTATLPPYNSPTKYDQTIRGYELWTHKDDILLLQHVLSRLQLGNWRELEAKFEGRHTARLCDARWKYLRDQLLKGIQNASTSC